MQPLRKYTLKLQIIAVAYIVVVLVFSAVLLVLADTHPQYAIALKVVSLLSLLSVACIPIFIGRRVAKRALEMKGGIAEIVADASLKEFPDKSDSEKPPTYFGKLIEDLIYLFFLAFRAKRRRWWNYLGAGNSHSSVIQETFVNCCCLYVIPLIAIIFRLIGVDIWAHKAAAVVCVLVAYFLTSRFLEKKYPKERVRDIIYEHGQTKKPLSWVVLLLFKCFLLGFFFLLLYLSVKI